MREKLVAMEKGRNLLAKRVEKLTAANEKAASEDCSSDLQALEEEAARLRAKTADESTMQV